MPHTTGPGLKIYYDTNGAKGEPLVLIEGLGAQGIAWRMGFVDKLIARGMQVTRMDNRDVGLSEKTADASQELGNYKLIDMADDVVRVLDEIGADWAHIVGQSMGGIIAQLLAIHHPSRVRSLNLVYTLPAFDPQFFSPEIAERLAQPMPPPPTTREEYVEWHVANERHAGSTEFEFDEAWIRNVANQYYDRGVRLDGVKRQQSAVMGFGDLRPELAKLKAPTAVIHGRADRLISATAALEFGRVIPNSEIHIYRGMGHQVVEPLWDEFADIIARNAARARLAT